MYHLHLSIFLSTKDRNTTSTHLKRLDALKRVHSIKSLRVTFTNGLSVALHVQQLTTSNAQLLYELKLLRADGLCDAAIQAVFRSVVLARFLYASPAWLGLCRSPGQWSLLIIQ